MNYKGGGYTLFWNIKIHIILYKNLIHHRHNIAKSRISIIPICIRNVLNFWQSLPNISFPLSTFETSQLMNPLLKLIHDAININLCADPIILSQRYCQGVDNYSPGSSICVKGIMAVFYILLVVKYNVLIPKELILVKYIIIKILDVYFPVIFLKKMIWVCFLRHHFWVINSCHTGLFFQYWMEFERYVCHHLLIIS